MQRLVIIWRFMINVLKLNFTLFTLPMLTPPTPFSCSRPKETCQTYVCVCERESVFRVCVRKYKNKVSLCSVSVFKINYLEFEFENYFSSLMKRSPRNLDNNNNRSEVYRSGRLQWLIWEGSTCACNAAWIRLAVAPHKYGTSAHSGAIESQGETN